VPLLNDEDLKFGVVISLGQIGDKSAIPPLMDILNDVRRPYMRLLAIRALEQLEAKEALPTLHALIDDGSAYFDLSVPLAGAAPEGYRQARAEALTTGDKMACRLDTS